MKALFLKSNTPKPWSKITDMVLGKESGRLNNLSFEDAREPDLPSENWVKIRTIASGISDLEENLFTSDDLSFYAPYIMPPFVPGNEVLGIVSELGKRVTNIEVGERVVVNPLLSCVSREITPMCSSCRDGKPWACYNFSKGVVSPGQNIGGCLQTSGGWAESLLAHSSNVYSTPAEITSDVAALIPAFSRAVEAILRHTPKPNEKVLVLGGRSQGLLTLVALDLLGIENKTMVIVDNPREANAASQFTTRPVMPLLGTKEAFYQAAEFTSGSIMQTFAGPELEGGFDLVFETTGNSDTLEDAFKMTCQNKKVVSTALMNNTRVNFNLPTRRNIIWAGSGFCGDHAVDGQRINSFDLACKLAFEHGLPSAAIVTHSFAPSEYEQISSLLAYERAAKPIKILIRHVI
jgi:threonine dehydrogenase-like Zn-dependent dehydrogenase